MSKDIEKFMLNELMRCSQQSWDFQADLSFAMKINYEHVDVIKDAMSSSAPFAFIVAAWKQYWDRQITQKRLRILRALVKQRLVRAYWSGTGWGGKSEFGLGRVRTYELSSTAKLILEQSEVKPS